MQVLRLTKIASFLNYIPNRRAVLITALSISSVPASAELPPGWINRDFISAYTQDARSVELTVEAIKVDDSIDFLDIREDLLAGNTRLTDDSGDLDGFNGTLNVGVFDTLSVYYRRQQQDLTVKVGAIRSINVLEIDQELKTTSQELGVKWTIYQAEFLSSGHAATAASVELSKLRNDTDDFGLSFDEIGLTSGGSTTNITFTEPQRAGMERMEDDGWNLRFIYTTALSDRITGSTWASYGAQEATSGTGTTIPLAAIRNALTKTFDLDEKVYRVGANLNWQLTPRMPLQVSYEYLQIANQDLVVDPGVPLAGLPLPGFLRSNTLSTEDSNHSLGVGLSWWLTPGIHLGLTARVSSNQFLGTIPHYNNPLSSSFADAPYGYLGLRLGIRLP